RPTGVVVAVGLVKTRPTRPTIRRTEMIGKPDDRLILSVRCKIWPRRELNYWETREYDARDAANTSELAAAPAGRARRAGVGRVSRAVRTAGHAADARTRIAGK